MLETLAATRLMFGVLAGLILSPAVFAGSEPPLIREIVVIAQDVFTEEEARSGWAYRATNRLHIQTRESVIRRFLLFREGELLDPMKIAETERNLRRLAFLSNASITVSEPVDGHVTVTVVTQDSWSTEPGLSAGSSGGAGSFGFELSEANLLGSGRSLALLYDQDPDRSGYGIYFRDPILFGRYWTAEGTLTRTTDGWQRDVSVRRPFFALDTSWAVDLSIKSNERHERLYRRMEVSDILEIEEHRAIASAGRAIHRTATTAHRLTTGLELQRAEFTAVGRQGVSSVDLLTERDFRYLFAGYEFLQSDFVKMNFINLDLRYDDINLGTEAAVRFGVSPRFMGAEDDTAMIELGLARGWRVAPGAIVRTRLSADTRLQAANDDATISSRTDFYRRFGTRYPQTLATRLQIDRTFDPDPQRQYLLDGEHGLRGYRLNAFEGVGRVVLNVEQRISLGRELWRVITPGAAVFFDAGMPIQEGVSVSHGEWKTNAGVGLRIGISRSPRNVLRVDLAYAFNPDPLGRSGWLLSFSSGHGF
jgi:hypothetical protein